MALTTEKTALIARFDMLFSQPMKAYVKRNGGASYIRNLVLRDLLEKLSNTRGTLSPAEVQAIQQAYDTETKIMEGKVA
jgi:hypothetical protein